jgi:hypothetical protein
MQEPVGYRDLGVWRPRRESTKVSESDPARDSVLRVSYVQTAASSQLGLLQGMPSTLNHFSDVKGTDAKEMEPCPRLLGYCWFAGEQEF